MVKSGEYNNIIKPDTDFIKLEGTRTEKLSFNLLRVPTSKTFEYHHEGHTFSKCT